MKERRINFDETLDYREVLFKGEDSLPLIEINFKLSTKSISDFIEFKNKISICGSDFYFKVSNSYLMNHRVCVHKICKVPYVPFCGIQPGFILTINNRGQFLYERKILEEIDSLDSLVFNSFFNESYYNLKDQFVIIDWVNHKLKDSIPEESFYKALNSVENSYLLIYDSLSRQYFNKKIHNLDSLGLLKLKKVLPFKIQIGGLIYPPLPPPVPLN